MTAYQFTIALMVFLVAYGVFEVPSNYFLKKFKPSVRAVGSSPVFQADIYSDGSHFSCLPGVRVL